MMVSRKQFYNKRNLVETNLSYTQNESYFWGMFIL